MSAYWKKVVKKIFERKPKKKNASDAIKEFDESKEKFSKELEDNKDSLQEKVVLLYQTSEIKTQILLKKPDYSIVEENALHTLNLVQDLARAGFPGASILSESLARFGASALPGPTTFLLLKASVLVADEPEPVREIPVEAATQEPHAEHPAEVEKAAVQEREVEIETKPSELAADSSAVPAASEKATITEETGKSKEEPQESEGVIAAPAPPDSATPIATENVPVAASLTEVIEPKVAHEPTELVSTPVPAAALPTEL